MSDSEYPHAHRPRSDIIGFGRAACFCRCLLTPSPTADLRDVVAIPRYVFTMFNQLVADRLLGVSGAGAGLRHAIDDVADQVKAIDVVHHTHIEGRAGGALFLVAAHVKVAVP